MRSRIWSSASASFAGAHLFLQPLAALLQPGQGRPGSPSSRLISSASRPGFNVAGGTWITSSSRSKAPHCTIASTSRMVARNLCPALPLARPFDQPGDVNENSTRGWKISLEAATHPRATSGRGSGTARCPPIGLDRAERGNWRLGLGIGHQGIEKGWICHVAAADDSGFEASGAKFYVAPLRRIPPTPAASHSFRRHRKTGNQRSRSPISRRTLEPARRCERSAPTVALFPSPDHPSPAPDPPPVL